MQDLQGFADASVKFAFRGATDYVPPAFPGLSKVFMSEDTLIREVDEELRRDRMRNIWRQFGPLVIAAAVLVVVGVAGYEGWTWWQKTQSDKSSDQFYAASELASGKDLAAAQKALDDVIAQGSGGYPTLARFREAALLSQNGKADEAIAAYDAISTAESNTHLREMALVLAANLLIDKGDPAAVEQRVLGLIQPQNPLRNAARETLGLTQYKAGQLDAALASFQAIIDDPLSTSDLRNRIQLYVIQLFAEGAKAPVTAPTDTTTTPADVSSQASTAIDASTELDVTPPVDASAVSTASSAPDASSSAP